MEWWHILILVLVIPIMCLPVALIWYVNIGGMIQAVKEAQQARAAREKTVGTVAATMK